MKIPAIIFMLSLCLMACAYRHTGPSYVGDLPSGQAVSAIAGDAAIYLSEQYAPGQTTLYLAVPPNPDNEFSLALDNSLRRKGFTIAPDNAADSVGIGYTLDALQDSNNGAWYLRLRLSDGKTVARVYDANGMPVAGWSAAVIQGTADKTSARDMPEADL